MHTYSTDTDRRVKVSAALGILSFLLTANVGFVTEAIGQFVPLGLDPSVVTTGMVFTIVLYIFSKKVWSLGLLNTLGIVTVPDLSGRWEGTLTPIDSATDSNKELTSDEDVQVEVRIKQTWRHMLIQLETDKSVSESLGASFVTDKIDPKIHYHYENSPKPGTSNTMSPHRGSAELTFVQASRDQLRGRYYTGADRQSYGEINLQRTNSRRSILDLI
ncbi:hypothetical protein [Halobaculum sp. EA56]|uniref:Cap15 family cyclic dinucleotide receptor domain-containing protein n=1 Tax=Halobaculum sp. EA56 TaxID=3421648 RepID=UPI003EB6F2BC